MQVSQPRTTQLPALRLPRRAIFFRPRRFPAREGRERAPAQPQRCDLRRFARRLPVFARLDAIDWKILKELQEDGRMTNVELARRVGISAPPCLRRVRALEEAGYIKGYRALLDEKRLG